MWGYFPNVITPIITSLTGLWLTVFIAKLIVPFVKEGSFFDSLGKNTFHIMANHLFCFYLISVFFLLINGLPLDTMAQADYVYYKYEPQKYAFLYALISIILTNGITDFVKKLKQKVFNL